ncbi:hypothetical protein M0657_010655 [Pyricularia oryzae]|nr:hypothetical protein M9X92_010395 [Pyricularia oryzae]KAI7912022.1 hypothetical protein M0657_010655 [Pyricularia oryzae]
MYYLGQVLRPPTELELTSILSAEVNTQFILAPKAIPTKLQMGNSPSPTKPHAMVTVRHFWLNSNC